MSKDYYHFDAENFNFDDENFVVTTAYLYYLVRENMNSTLLLYKGHHYFIEPNRINSKYPDYFVGHLEHYEDDTEYHFDTFTELMDYKVHDGRRLEDVLEEMEQLQ